jgi:hypothetical protein
VQSKSKCLGHRNPGGSRNNMPHRHTVPRTQGRVRRLGRTCMAWKLIALLEPVRVCQFLTPPSQL